MLEKDGELLREFEQACGSNLQVAEFSVTHSEAEFKNRLDDLLGRPCGRLWCCGRPRRSCFS
jgi:hypothetical protein